MNKDIYDVIVIGAGPAGMNAALYVSRANLNVLMIEKECPGGKMLKTQKIENYIGVLNSNAFELASTMFKQSIQFGAKYKQGNVVEIKNLGDLKTIKLASGETLSSKALIIATGGRISNNNFKYDCYLNKGLSYCVVCDANFYKDKNVAIIGSNKDIDDVDYLANIAKNVYFINREDAVSNRENVKTYSHVENYEIDGREKVECIIVENTKIVIEGVFYIDDSNNFNGFVKDLELENGFIKTDKNMHTNIDGIYACGDIVNKNIKQVISACGDGALAALEAIKYVNKLK